MKTNLSMGNGKQSMKEKKLLFSVTREDFSMQTFSVGGAGGGGKDTSNSGVRLVHEASGARGEGREHRSVTQNRKAAFMRLVNSKEFLSWHRAEVARRLNLPHIETEREIYERIDRMIDAGLRDGTILVEAV